MAGSVAGMLLPVLTDIGCGTLSAGHRRRTIIIGEGAGQGPRSVIVQVADFVRQPVEKKNMMMVVVADPRLGRARRPGRTELRRRLASGGSSGFSGERPAGRHFRRSKVPIQPTPSEKCGN